MGDLTEARLYPSPGDSVDDEDVVKRQRIDDQQVGVVPLPGAPDPTMGHASVMGMEELLQQGADPLMQHTVLQMAHGVHQAPMGDPTSGVMPLQHSELGLACPGPSQELDTSYQKQDTYRHKSRRKASEKPKGADQVRQAFSKRKRGLALKAYQLHKITDSKVFFFIRNDKGSTWAYATPGFGASLNHAHLKALRLLAGEEENPAGSKVAPDTEIMPHPQKGDPDDRDVHLSVSEHQGMLSPEQQWAHHQGMDPNMANAMHGMDPAAQVQGQMAVPLAPPQQLHDPSQYLPPQDAMGQGHPAESMVYMGGVGDGMQPGMQPGLPCQAMHVQPEGSQPVSGVMMGSQPAQVAIPSQGIPGGIMASQPMPLAMPSQAMQEGMGGQAAIPSGMPGQGMIQVGAQYPQGTISDTGMPTQGMPTQGQGLPTGAAVQGGMPSQGLQGGMSGQGLQGGIPGQSLQGGMPGQGLQSGMPGQGLQGGMNGQGLQSGMTTMEGIPYTGASAAMTMEGHQQTVTLGMPIGQMDALHMHQLGYGSSGLIQLPSHLQQQHAAEHVHEPPHPPHMQPQPQHVHEQQNMHPHVDHAHMQHLQQQQQQQQQHLGQEQHVALQHHMHPQVDHLHLQQQQQQQQQQQLHTQPLQNSQALQKLERGADADAPQ